MFVFSMKGETQEVGYCTDAIYMAVYYQSQKYWSPQLFQISVPLDRKYIDEIARIMLIDLLNI